ncbi:hypothetical protein BLOT_009542 [Blomia tropicalis]|nr:hypothetical protein BLOT_009542 [Blomia tropicalis]
MDACHSLSTVNVEDGMKEKRRKWGMGEKRFISPKPYLKDHWPITSDPMDSDVSVAETDQLLREQQQQQQQE